MVLFLSASYNLAKKKCTRVNGISFSSIKTLKSVDAIPPGILRQRRDGPKAKTSPRKRMRLPLGAFVVLLLLLFFSFSFNNIIVELYTFHLNNKEEKGYSERLRLERGRKREILRTIGKDEA